MFVLGKRSRKNLEGIHSNLLLVVEKAIQLTTIDFAVTQGLRTLEEQKKLFESGASQTMKSKHLTGHAVDVVALPDGRVSWEIAYYLKIAEAFMRASSLLEIGLRWGGAWSVRNVGEYPKTIEDAHMDYLKSCVVAGKRPFIDSPHFELTGG